VIIASGCVQAIRYIVNQMDRYLLAQREYRTGCMVRIKHFIAKMCCIVGGKLYGNYLISATRRRRRDHTAQSTALAGALPLIIALVLPYLLTDLHSVL